MCWLDWFRRLGLFGFGGFTVSSGCRMVWFRRWALVAELLHLQRLCFWVVVWWVLRVLLAGYDCFLGFLFMDCFGVNSSCGCLWASGSFGFILVVGDLSLVCFASGWLIWCIVAFGFLWLG